MADRLTPEQLLAGYARGIFPMSESRDDPEIFWLDPTLRGILPIAAFHISRSLARRIRRGAFHVTLNQDFEGVLDGCAGRPETWINAEIRALYLELHRIGHAQSIEIYMESELAGGVYGVTLGGAFFGESMFSRKTDASKLALAFLTAHLEKTGFTLFDTQFLTPHLASLGAFEIPRQTYQQHLAHALRLQASFRLYSEAPSPESVLQRKTQTS